MLGPSSESLDLFTEPGAGHQMLLSQKVEIAPEIGLRDMLEEKPSVSACIVRRRRFKLRKPVRDFLSGNVQLQAAVRHTQLDLIAGSDNAQRTSSGGFGRDVQHHRSEARATHASIADANDIIDIPLEQRARHRN